MVSLAVSSMFFHEYPLDEVFDYVAEGGLDTLEFWQETPHFWLRGMPVDELRQALQEHPEFRPFTFHAPILDLNPCSINPQVAAVSLEYVLGSVAMADELGASTLTVHPGRRTAKRPPGGPDYRRFEHYITRLAESARGRKVRVAIENMERKINSLCSTPDSVREVLDDHSWLSFTLDVSHAMGGSLEEVFAYIDLCGDRLVNIHLGRANSGKMHLPVDGSPEIEAVLRRLGDSGYRGSITLEIEDMNFDHGLSSEEKIVFLKRQAAFVRGCID